ncbi:structural protein [Paracoccus phage vB_PmaP_KLEP18-1]|nr:structural protein [Paracoccus phage vB_PmaP_KLEP18-1]
MPGGSQSTTQTTRSEPWSAAQPALRDAISAGQALFNQGGFAPNPYQGNRVAGLGQTTQQGMDQIRQQAAGGTPGIDAAMGSLTGMLDGRTQYQNMQGVRDQILGGAIPAAVAQFSGSGMTNSSVAMDQVGSAATAALAPFEYDAFNQQQGRALQAAQMMPGLTRAQYTPGEMLMGVGGAQDANRQAQIDARMQRYYETQNQPAANYQGYLSAMMGLGGMGGTNTATGPSGQPGTGARIAGAGLGGLGTYGALAMNPVTAPFALAGGGLAALSGLF